MRAAAALALVMTSCATAPANAGDEGKPVAREVKDDTVHDWNWYRAHDFDHLSDHINEVLDGRLEAAPCALTGDCVAAAAKTATFPPSDGATGPHVFSLK